MDNIPVATDGPNPAARNTARPAQMPAQNGKSPKSKLKIKVAALVAGVVILAALIFGAWSFYQSTPGAHIDKGRYQAVFFTNGQVYFGKLHKLGGGYFSLTDIFYIQAKNSEDTTADSANPQKTSNDPSSDLQLIKLGSEVHGPTDKMVISKEQILFFENLKDDGKVADTITKYNNQQKN